MVRFPPPQIARYVLPPPLRIPNSSCGGSNGLSLQAQIYYHVGTFRGCGHTDGPQARSCQCMMLGALQRKTALIGYQKSLSIAKNHPKPSPEFSEHFIPSIHKMTALSRIRSRPGKPNQKKGQNEKFMNFAHFCEFWCFSLGKQARFTLNFCSGMPL